MYLSELLFYVMMLHILKNLLNSFTCVTARVGLSTDSVKYLLQLLVNGQLSRKENIWLSRLRRNLSVENDIEILAGEYRGREKNPDYAAVMNLIVQANREQCEEAKVMCEALRELFAEELAEAAFGREQGRAAGLAEGRAEAGQRQYWKF